MRRCALLLCGALIACSPDRGSKDSLETVEIGGAVDEGLTLEEDVQAEQTGPGLAGALPGGFPADFPVYRPASVTDFGETEDGEFVEIAVPSALADIDAWLDRSAAAEGWSTAGDGLYTKGERAVRVHLSEGVTGTTVRIDYRPGA